MSRPVHLACPVCGAPRRPGIVRCDYCGSWLTIFVDLDDATVNETVIRDHISRFRDVLQAQPDDVVALHGLGVALRSLGLLDDAIRALARAANRRPESLAIQRALAGTLLDAVRDRPDNPRMWRDVHRQADRVLALDPDAVDGWRLRAEAVLRTRDDAALIALVPDLVRHDPDGDHQRIARRLMALGDRKLRDWRWSEAVNAWAALAVLDPAAGRGALAGFLVDNARLVPRSEGRVWRAVRQTMVKRGDFRMSTLAALTIGLAVAIALVLLAFWLDRNLIPIVTVFGAIVLPVLSVVAVRTWLAGWPPYPVPRLPWAAVGTDDLVRAAREVAPDIERIRPAA